MNQRTPIPGHLQENVVLATPPQISYLEGLRDGKDLTSLSQEQQVWLKDATAERFAKLSKGKASELITKLKELDWIPGESSGDSVVRLRGVEADVKSGRYAIEKDGKLMFYSVKVGKARVFVDVWASDARWPVKNMQERIRILEAILADPDAGPRFGREIGRCYVCGRTLTDETSRSLGIGPVCRGDE